MCSCCPFRWRQPATCRGLEFRPSNPRVAHHANILLDRTATSRERNDQDPTLGEQGLLAATAVYPQGHFLGWTPGQPDPLLPENLAWPLEPNTDLVVQLHLKPSGKPEPIRFRVAFFFGARAPDRTPAVLRLGRQNIDIPAGERGYRIIDSYELPVDIQVLALKPHAHYRAREIHAFAALPGGEIKWLLYIRDWDFQWQHVYRYVDPVMLPARTRITMEYSLRQRRREHPQSRTAFEARPMGTSFVRRDGRPLDSGIATRP